MRIVFQTIIVLASCTALAGCLKGKIPFQTTQSGLQISILREGNGPAVVAGAEVEIHEITSLINGELLFSTYRRGKPFRFCQGRGIVIKGVDEAVLGMKTGEIRAVIVPPHLHGRKYSKKYAPEDSLHYRLELVRIVSRTCNQLSKPDNEMSNQILFLLRDFGHFTTRSFRG